MNMTVSIADDAELAFFNAQDIRVVLEEVGCVQDVKIKTKFRGKSATYDVFKGKAGAWLATDFASRKTYGVVQVYRNETGLSLGAARIALRSIFGTMTKPKTKHFTDTTTSTDTSINNSTSQSPISSSTPQKTNPNADLEIKLTEEQVRTQYSRAHEYDIRKHPKILSDRGIEYVSHEYRDSFRITSSGSFVTPVFQFDGESGIGVMSGYEQRKTTGEKFFSKGGSAGAWVANLAGDGTLVITESAFDCLALALTHYMCASPTLAAVRAGAEVHVANLAKWMSKEGLLHTVVITTDNDSAGLAYAAKIMNLIDTAKRRGEMKSDIHVVYVPPSYRQHDKFTKDSNDHLKNVVSSYDHVRQKMLSLRKSEIDDESEGRGAIELTMGVVAEPLPDA